MLAKKATPSLNTEGWLHDQMIRLLTTIFQILWSKVKL
jgi:hypothetical protein